MRPEDEAMLARLPAKRRDEVRTALEQLDQMRKEWAGTPDDKLPPEVRERALAASQVVRRATQSPVHGINLAIGLLLAAISLGLAIYEPVTFYTFTTSGEGNVRCLIRERSLGLIPVGRVVRLPNIASATGERWRKSEQETDANGKQHTVTKTIQRLTLADASGRTVHERSQEYVLGANMEEVARNVQAMAEGRKPASLVRWTTVWPAHLVVSLFGLVGVAMLWSVLATTVFRLSFKPLLWLSRPYMSGFVFALAFAALLVSWGIVLFGGAPPGWLVGALRLKS